MATTIAAAGGGIQTTAVDAALGLLRTAATETGWTSEALAAHLAEATGKKWTRDRVWRVLQGERPLTLPFLCALPDDLEARYELLRAESFGHVVVEPLVGPAAIKAIVAGLVGVLQLPAARMAKAAVGGSARAEVA